MISLELLQTFCTRSWEARPGWMTKPYNFALFTYATDGRVMVRVPRLDAVKNDLELWGDPDDPQAVMASAKHLQQSAGFFEQSYAAGPSQELALMVIPSSWRERPCECLKDGGPYMECEHCEGDGIAVEQPIMVPFGSKAQHRLSHVYLNLMKALPGCRLFENPVGLAETHPLTFTFEGGEGRLMPMRHPTTQEIAS